VTPIEAHGARASDSKLNDDSWIALNSLGVALVVAGFALAYFTNYVMAGIASSKLRWHTRRVNRMLFGSISTTA
jgi:opacity protein-like surface antigen